MLLPRPYADEIIGSTLLRGCRQLGIPPKRLAPLLRGGSTAPPSPFLPSCIGMIAQAMGLPAHEILHGHTVFPYVTAFMDHEKIARLEQKLLGSVPLENSCFAALQSRAAIPYLRVCRRCIRAELSLYGECYWHRSHLLPGVHVCPNHGDQLWEAELSCKGFFRTTLPNEAKCSRYQTSLKPSLLQQIALASNELLHCEHTGPTTAVLRRLAFEKGYCLVDNEIPSVKICRDILDFYGEAYLGEAHCRYSLNKKSAWPALILRESSKDLAPFKYLLMGIFLRSCRRLDSTLTRESAGYRQPGPTAQYRDMECLAVLAIQGRLKALASAEQRTTVKALLLDTGIWDRFRHNRAAFPALAKLMSEFRLSDQSERQIGKRLRWRKKTK